MKTEHLQQLLVSGQFIGSHMCLAKDIGSNGNLFGGNMLAWADEMGAIFAKKFTGEPKLVTVQMDAVEFTVPVHEGEIVDFYAANPKPGHTSLTFTLVVAKPNNADGVRQIVFTTRFVFVAVGDDGHSKPIERFAEKRP